MGQISTCLTHPVISLPILCQYLGALQDWSDALPDTLRRSPTSQPSPHIRAVYFLSLRWYDAVMIAMKPFLASLVRVGSPALPVSLRRFFAFCARTGSLAARECVSLMKQMESQQLLKGLLSFEEHFLVQSASLLALNLVLISGDRQERVRFSECVDILTRLPGFQPTSLLKDMRLLEHNLSRFATFKNTQPEYFLRDLS
jgi:hypothetical protein